MEILLERVNEAQGRVTCDRTFSHLFDIAPLLHKDVSEVDLLRDQPESYGKRLYVALFPAGSYAQAQLCMRPERLVLVATDPGLDAVPWEYLYGLFGDEQETTAGFLVLECAFVRGVPEQMRVAAVELKGGLQIVAVPANPLSQDVVPLNIDGEWMRLKEIINEVPSAVTLERARPATLERTRQLVVARKGCVVHFMGHGGQDKQGGLLCFEKENGALAVVHAREFIQRMRSAVFLVTLNACVSATPGLTPFGNLAASLVRQKIPYALGMRFSIVDRDARDFSRTFYSELAQGIPVEEALLQARLTLAESTRGWAVGVPVLYTSLAAPAPGFPYLEGTATVKEYQPPMEVSTLPRAEGVFQGRSGELQQIGSRLTGDARPRVLTLHGGGGQGKTALAREVAERFAFAWPGGVWAVSLEHLPERGSVVTDLAAFLNIPAQETLDLAATERLILRRLAEKRTLLILDNVETLIEGVERQERVALDLVAWCKQLPGPTVSLLVTSRMVLGWAGEETYDLGGLTAEEGAALFQQSAPQRGEEIARGRDLARQLSEQLEGHPLSLRLLGGAFNAESTPLPVFVQECERRLLEAEDKYVGPEHRHRKLYACLETSVRALEAPVARLLSGLVIFHAPFWSEMAEQVFQFEEGEKAADSVADQVYILWQRGLLARKRYSTREGEVQFYYLLPTTRPYLERYLPSAYEQEVVLTRFGKAIRNQLRWLYDRLDSLAAASLYVKEAQEDVERGIACLEGSEWGYALREWSWIVARMGNRARALELLEEVMEMAQGTDEGLRVAASYVMAGVYSDIGKPQEALRLYEEALPIRREVGDRAGEGATLNNMALVYRAIGKPEEALRLYEEALPIMREVGDRAGEGATLNNLALLYWNLQRYEDAAVAFEESLLIHQQVSRVAGEIAVLVGMAGLYADHPQRMEDARVALERAIALFQSTGLPRDAAGNTLMDVQRRLLRIQGAASSQQEEPGAGKELELAIVDFVNAKDWDGSRQVLESRQALLLQAEAEEFLAGAIQQAKAGGNERLGQVLEVHLALLQVCRREGIEEGFARLREAEEGEA